MILFPYGKDEALSETIPQKEKAMTTPAPAPKAASPYLADSDEFVELAAKAVDTGVDRRADGLGFVVWVELVDGQVKRFPFAKEDAATAFKTRFRG